MVPFVKMHGLGNDYVFVDLVAHDLPGVGEDEFPVLSRAVSDRHRGVGSDGLILVLPPVQDGGPYRMRIFNADGSEAEMCGNGVRCFAFYLHSRGYCRGPDCQVDTLAGPIHTRILHVEAVGGQPRWARVRVDMGPPRGWRELAVPVAGREFRMIAVSMGNPHAVIMDGWSEEDFPVYGPQLERHPAFPQGTNVEFVRIRHPGDAGERGHLEVLVWERGSGPTQACGTGACAAVVAAALQGRAARQARVSLPGGDLEVEWSAEGNVYMTGPAHEVCRGEFLWP
ncbi:MAG: diaminopimelate epimerase [Bacillota bacterium]